MKVAASLDKLPTLLIIDSLKSLKSHITPEAYQWHLRSLHKAKESDQKLSFVTKKSFAPEIELLDNELRWFAQYSSLNESDPLIYSLLQEKAKRKENHLML